MITPMEMNDHELLEKFKSCTLSPTFLTHTVLLRITWILLEQYGLDRSLVKNVELKENYFLNVLKNNKFNKTLTIAYTEILNHFKELSSANNFDTLLQEFPRLRYDFKALVKTHYGYNILKEHRKEEPKQMRPILFTF